MPATRILLIVAISAAACAGCDRPAPKLNDATGVVSTDEVLDRCVAAYGALRTLHARGMLNDFRPENRRTVPIEWELVRPGRCRVQVGQKVAIVIGDNWWTYDDVSGQFRKHKAFTRTPMETAGLLISDGVPFLLPAIFTRGEAAFGKSRGRGYPEWQLIGVAWSSQRPCYVVASPGHGTDGTSTLRIWIDQDSHLLRSWDLIKRNEEGARESTLLECTYKELTANAPIPAERFSFTPPAAKSLGRAGQ